MAKLPKVKRSRIPPPIAPTIQIDLDGDWKQFTRLLPKDCEVIGVVTIAGNDSGALVKLPPQHGEAGAYVKVTGGEVAMLNQHKVLMKLDALERQTYNPPLEMVAVD